MSIHDRVMTPHRAPSNPALRVAPQWPPGGAARLEQTASLPGAAQHRLAATGKQRDLLRIGQQTLDHAANPQLQSGLGSGWERTSDAAAASSVADANACSAWRK
jgi:hypothetical protein